MLMLFRIPKHVTNLNEIEIDMIYEYFCFGVNSGKAHLIVTVKF